MLIDCYPYDDVFARVPELAHQTDPVLRQLDCLLDDDLLYQQVRADLGKRYPLTLLAGRHSTPGEAILRLLVAKHLYNWSYRETEERVADSLVMRSLLPDLLPSRAQFQYPAALVADHPARDSARPQRSGGAACPAGKGNQGTEAADRRNGGGHDDPPSDGQ